MDQFDCIIVGNNVPSLISALFLARKMRRILVFHDRTSANLKKHQVTMPISENQTITIQYPLQTALPGLNKSSLVRRFLETCGMEEEIKGFEISADIVVENDGLLRKRSNHFEQFKVHLIRHYPKQRDAIIRFFDDGFKFYQNYIQQQNHMLDNTDYTISSFMIEWGDYSVYEILAKYFTDEAIFSEFQAHPAIAHLDLKTLHTVHFFVPFFLELTEGNTFWLETEATMIRKLIQKIQVINPKAVLNQKIKQFQQNEKGKITAVIDKEGQEYYAKYFIVGDELEPFTKQFFPTLTFEKQVPYFPKAEQTFPGQSLFVLLKHPLSNIDLTDSSYLFKKQEESDFSLIRMMDYTLVEPGIVPSKQGLIQVDYWAQTQSLPTPDLVLKRLYTYFPKLERLVLETATTNVVYRQATLPDEAYRKGRSINDQIEIEAAQPAYLFENLVLTSPSYRSESGNYHQVHGGVLIGDQIEEKLYYGDDEDDSFYYLTNDEIMMMLKHNFRKSGLGPKEHHINFYVGKSNYFIRTKANILTIHRGMYNSPDLAIYTTNDTLANLLLKKMTFEDALKSGSLRYLGEESFLYEVVNAFVLDDYKLFEAQVKPTIKLYFLGVKFLFVYLGVWALMAFLSNYFELIWILPGAIVLQGVTLYLKNKQFKQTHWFEITLLSMSAVFLILAIVFPSFNQSRNDDYFLAFMGGLLLVTGLIEKGVVWGFHRFDFQSDYANSSLFKIIANGLTLVWAMLFLAILGITYVTSQRYVSANYYLIFLGFFLTYYYPVIYVKTNIKK